MRLTCAVLMLFIGTVFVSVWAAAPNIANASIPWVLTVVLVLVAIEWVARWRQHRGRA